MTDETQNQEKTSSETSHEDTPAYFRIDLFRQDCDVAETRCRVDILTPAPDYCQKHKVLTDNTRLDLTVIPADEKVGYDLELAAQALRRLADELEHEIVRRDRREMVKALDKRVENYGSRRYDTPKVENGVPF